MVARKLINMEPLEYNQARKKFKFEHPLSGDPEKDKRELLLNFQKAVDLYFTPRVKRVPDYGQPERL